MSSRCHPGIAPCLTSLWGLVSLPLALCSIPSLPPPQEEALVLEELWSAPIPRRMEISGGMIVHENEVLVWSRRSGEVFRLSSDSFVSLCPELVREPVGGGLLANGVFEVVDADGPRLISKPRTGSCLQESRSFAGVALQAARRIDEDGWIVTGSDLSGRSGVFGLGDSGRIRWSAFASGESEDPLDGLTSHLSVEDGRAILSSMHWPFHWMVVGSSGAVMVRGNPFLHAPEVAAPDSVDLVGWIGLPSLILDGGTLQTLADPGSDNRLIILYDNEGEAIRYAAIDAAIGFIDADSSRNLLLGIRRTDVPEMVVYRWRRRDGREDVPATRWEG